MCVYIYIYVDIYVYVRMYVCARLGSAALVYTCFYVAVGLGESRRLAPTLRMAKGRGLFGTLFGGVVRELYGVVRELI